MLYVYLVLDDKKKELGCTVSILLRGKDQADLQKNALETIEEFAAVGLPLKRVKAWEYYLYRLFS